MPIKRENYEMLEYRRLGVLGDPVDILQVAPRHAMSNLVVTPTYSDLWQ